eukprot:jgi/Tetstr1/457696/TSEL_044243.t1
MMDVWEEKEWAERDREIEGLQEERLGILANALEVREANIESMAYDRVDGYREREEAKREKVYAAIQKRRIKAVRHLTTARKMADSTLKEKKTIIQKYGDFGSDVYAPLQRAGRFPDSKPAGREINPDQFTPKTLHGIYDLENSVPERKLEPRIKPPKNNQRLDANGRKDRAIGMDLDHIDSLLESTKAQGGRGFGDCWPYPLATDAKIKKDKRQRNIVERPSTPVAPPVPVSAKRHAAATLLQRLLRGRAVQNIMYEGKTRRLELIQELRLEETAQQREAELLQTARSSAVAVGRADTAPRTLPLPGVLQVQDAVVDDIVGAAIVEVMNVLTMEPGEEQTSMLRELMTKYAPPAAEDVDADEAATKIQSVFRGHQARQSIDSEEKRQAQAEQETEEPIRYLADQEAAAVKIQARTRGMLTRKHQKTTKTSKSSKTSKTSKTTKTTKTNKQTKKSNITTRRHQLSPEQVEELGDVDEGAVVKMQAQSRGFLARKKVQVAKAAKAKYGEDEDKIVKIQAQGRKYLAKKRVAAMRNPEGPSKDDGEEEEAEGGSSSSSSASSSDGEHQEVGEAGADADDNGEDAELPDLNQFSEEEQQKIVKMQAQGRGYIARKQVKAKKEGGPGSEAAGSADIAVPGADDSAGEGIASAVAAADEELPDLSQFSEAEQQKIVKMQAQGRGYIARKQVKAKKDSGAADGAAGSAAAAEQPDMGSASNAPAADPGADAGESGAGEDGGNADAPAAPAGDGMAAELPDLSQFSEEEQQKIVKMQAQGRGYIARKQVKAKKEGSLGGEAAVSADIAALGADGSADDKQEDAGLPELSQFSEAEQQKIVKMQAQGRGYIARKQVKAKKDGGAADGAAGSAAAAEQPDMGSASNAPAADPGADAGESGAGEDGGNADAPAAPAGDGMAAELPDLSQFSEEEQQKIVKMQAQGRGYIARKQVKAKKEGGPGGEAAGSADIAAPGADGSADDKQEDAGLPDLSQFSEAEQQKIVKMQAQGRGYIARKQVKAKKDGGAADGAAGSAAAAEQPDMGSASDAPAADPGADAGESGAGEDGGNADAPAAPAGDGMAAELPDLSQFSEEEQQKIVKMQAQGRGYIARKQVKAKKEGSLGEAAASSTSQAHEATASAEAAAQAGATAQPADDVAAAPEAAAGDVASSSPPAGHAPGIGAGEADAEPTVVDEDGFPAPAPAAADTPAASADAGNAAAADQTDASAAADSAVAGDSAPDAPEQLEAAAAAADVGAGEVAPEGEPAGESVAAAPGPDAEGDAMGGVDDAAAADPSDGQIVSQPELPDLSKFTDEEQQKVVKMQAQGRGYITRKHMKEQQQSATSFTTVQTRADTNVAARTSEHRSESSEMHHRSSSTTQQSRTETSSTQQQTVSSSSTSVETSSTKVEMTSSAQVFSTSSTVETSSSAQMHHSSSTEVRVEHSSSAQKSETTTTRSESAAAVSSTAEVSEVADAAVAE